MFGQIYNHIRTYFFPEVEANLLILGCFPLSKKLKNVSFRVHLGISLDLFIVRNGLADISPKAICYNHFSVWESNERQSAWC